MNQMRGGIMYNQREIVLIPFPYSDLSASKLRPALIIYNKKINKNEDRICCLITSNPTNDGILLSKEDFEGGKLPFKSWVKPYRLFTVNSKIIRKNLCSVKIKFHDKILEEINSFLRVL